MTEDKVGKLEKGYAADLAVLDVRTMKTLSLNNPIDLVVNYLEGDNVTDVRLAGSLWSRTVGSKLWMRRKYWRSC
jgi:cytosine/adenosine deaminase-related metal-dependent hydrolase